MWASKAGVLPAQLGTLNWLFMYSPPASSSGYGTSVSSASRSGLSNGSLAPPLAGSSKSTSWGASTSQSTSRTSQSSSSSSEPCRDGFTRRVDMHGPDDHVEVCCYPSNSTGTPELTWVRFPDHPVPISVCIEIKCRPGTCTVGQTLPWCYVEDEITRERTHFRPVCCPTKPTGTHTNTTVATSGSGTNSPNGRLALSCPPKLTGQCSAQSTDIYLCSEAAAQNWRWVSQCLADRRAECEAGGGTFRGDPVPTATEDPGGIFDNCNRTDTATFDCTYPQT